MAKRLETTTNFGQVVDVLGMTRKKIHKLVNPRMPGPDSVLSFFIHMNKPKYARETFDLGYFMDFSVAFGVHPKSLITGPYPRDFEDNIYHHKSYPNWKRFIKTNPKLPSDRWIDQHLGKAGQGLKHKTGMDRMKWALELWSTVIRSSGFEPQLMGSVEDYWNLLQRGYGGMLYDLIDEITAPRPAA